MTTNASAYSRPDGERRLTTNLNYLFPLDKQIVSLSSPHPLDALLFIGLPSNIAYAPSDTARSIFAGHLIARPDRVCPTSHITNLRGEDWDESLARELLPKGLTTLESRFGNEGFDVYHIGHRMNLEWYTEEKYQDSLIEHL